MSESTPGGPRSVFTEQRLFVSQRRKLIELTSEYTVYGADGQPVGAVAEVRQDGVHKALRLTTGWDQFMTHTIEVRDLAGRPLLVLTRPAKLIRSTMIVARPDGTELGRLVQRTSLRRMRFGLEADGTEIGSLDAENWRGWNFTIRDHAGAEIARVTKTWAGLLATMFPTADNYLVDLRAPLADPLASLVIAAALTIDTVTKRRARRLA